MELEKIKAAVADQLGIDEDRVTPDASFADDLGADSLDMAELAMVFEEEFEIQIPDEDIDMIQTVGDVVDYIKKHAE